MRDLCGKKLVLFNNPVLLSAIIKKQYGKKMSNFENRSFIPRNELEDMSKGLTRTFIPRAEVEGLYNLGPAKQMKQQRHIGVQYVTRETVDASNDSFDPE